jgi:hypothetical protein
MDVMWPRSGRLATDDRLSSSPSRHSAVTVNVFDVRIEAGVGIATLYRHFPTRESLVEAVYRDQVAGLTAGARELLAQLPPPAALRRWMDLFGHQRPSR